MEITPERLSSLGADTAPSERIAFLIAANNSVDELNYADGRPELFFWSYSETLGSFTLGKKSCHLSIPLRDRRLMNRGDWVGCIPSGIL